MPFLVVLISMTMVTSFYYNSRSFKVEIVTIKATNFQLSSSSIIPKERWSNAYYNSNSKIFQNFNSFLVFFGYIFFSIFGTAGMAFYGSQLMKKWSHKPKLPQPEEHIMGKTVLREFAESIIKKSRMVYDLNEDFKRNRSKMTPKVSKNKSRIMQKTIHEIGQMREEFFEMKQIHDCEANFVDENPLTYIVYLVLGLLFIALGFINTTHNLYWLYNDSNYIMDLLYFYFRETFGEMAVYLLLLALYGMIIISMVQGRQKLASMTPSWLLSKYYLREDKTWTDHFLAMINFLLICSLSVCSLYARQFTCLFIHTGLYRTFARSVASVNPYFILYSSNFFAYTMIIFFLVGFIITFFEDAPKERLTRLIKDRKEDLKMQQQILKENPGIV